MRFLPTILLILSLPAGLLGYSLGVSVLSALPLPEGAQGFLVLFVPLFIAGIFMVPFLVPFLDRRAKQDLAAHAGRAESVANGTGDTPGEEQHASGRHAGRG
ncbi:MAG: hypothetical protein A2Z32_03260 [Chloroflexi bacterium RBG_16_69_14]|nr:MAG: hypothetical protein A2Z32_03260 [Chloroflexi bacterium RBG_16_69_14]